MPFLRANRAAGRSSMWRCRTRGMWRRRWHAATADRALRLRPLADEGTLEVGIPTFGLEDHLLVQHKPIELVYLDLDRLSAEANRAYGQGLSSEGYTTALLYILARSKVFHDA